MRITNGEDMSQLKQCKTVLLIEDSIIERQRMAILLSKLGMEVTEVGDGVAALMELAAGDFDLVLADWQLPELSGLEVCRQVNKMPLSVRPYVIMVTGRKQRADLIAAMDAGADDYMSKPVWREELRVRVQSAERSLARQSVGVTLA